MIPVTLADLSLWLRTDFAVVGAEADQARVLILLDAAEDLIARASTSTTSDAFARYVTLEVVKRAWDSRDTNTSYISESLTQGQATHSYTRAKSAVASTVHLTDDERKALAGSSSSSRARSVGLSGLDLRSVLTDGGVV